MKRITLTIRDVEKTALRILAESEYRDLNSQAALIIRRELERLGLLAVENTCDQQNSECPEAASNAGN